MPMLNEMPIGSKLPNGATLMAYRCDTRQNHLPGVVLARWEKWRGTEYITWNTVYGRPNTTSTGHYFTDYHKALADYHKRLGKL